MVKTERAGGRNTLWPSSFVRNDEVDVGRDSNRQLTCCGEELEFFWLDDGRCTSHCRQCGQKFTDSTRIRYGGSPWIGVDLDGTLARDVGPGQGGKIGTPVKPMMDRVKQWIAEGQTVKIFTARASSSTQVMAIKQWLAKHGMPDMEVTNVKDMLMIALWDDRCVQVATNSGEPVSNGATPRQKRRPVSQDVGRQGISFQIFNRIKVALF